MVEPGGYYSRTDQPDGGWSSCDCLGLVRHVVRKHSGMFHDHGQQLGRIGHVRELFVPLSGILFPALFCQKAETGVKDTTGYVHSITFY